MNYFFNHDVKSHVIQCHDVKRGERVMLCSCHATDTDRGLREGRTGWRDKGEGGLMPESKEDGLKKEEKENGEEL